MIRFDTVEIDFDTREVRRDGDVVHLEPQAFDVLRYLVEHRDRVVPKTELLDEVWGDQFVSESALTTRIKEARRAVGDDGKAQRAIRNFRGRGYRFVADATDDMTAISVERGALRSVEAQLFGRDGDIAALVDTLATNRIVTLVGPGGVGKTTLARAAATVHGPDRRDGSVFVDLATASTAEAVLPTIRAASTIGAPDDRLDDTTATIAALDAVLVLDNCEHLVDEVATLVDRIVALPGSVSILATSREWLGVRGERVHVVEPLDDDAAEQLFVDRARAAAPDFGVSEIARPSLLELLDAIDRLPLAIEMAASRMSAMSIAEVVEMLRTDIGQLRSPERSPVERHRTLAAVVDWSERLLDDAQAALLRDLAVFAGPVTIDDIVGVVSDHGDDRLQIVDRLLALVDRSLVAADTAEATTRYRLFEMVKAHVSERSPASRRRRHAEWYARAAATARDALGTPNEGAGNDWYQRSIPELRQAVLWAAEHDRALACRLILDTTTYAHTRLWSEQARWAADLIDHVVDPVDVARLSATLAADAAHRSRLDDAMRHAQTALDGPDPYSRLWALDTLTDVHIYLGNLESSQHFAQRLADLGTELDDQSAVEYARASLALALVYGGDCVGGLELLAAHPVGSSGSPTDRAWWYYAVGEATVDDDVARSIDSFERAIHLAQSVGNRFVESVSRVSIAAATGRSGDPRDAARLFAETLRQFRRTGNLTHATTTLRNVVVFLTRIGDDRAAMTLLGSLSDDAIKATYGAEEERLEACRSIALERSGAAAVEGWIMAGRGRTITEAIGAAMADLAGHPSA